MYSLQECLTNSKRFRRAKYVYKVLCENDIRDWDDLLTKPIPITGISNNEILALDDLRHKELFIRVHKHKAISDIAKALSKHTTRNEASRIAGIVVNQGGIYSLYRLYATSNDRLEKLPGIGKKRMEVLKEMKAEINTTPTNRATTHAAQLALPFNSVTL